MTRVKNDILANANELIVRFKNGGKYRLLIDTLQVELVKDNYGQDCVFINNRLWKVKEVS
ncbi:MAG: hypothetical protein P794_01600 [Epsilonproteobacteria bacterium (ex Lamellibrachia satsuma)]|nr:MAG: hypothetical protein P794_01600 [Epsilonproteobacteria bacterium (ex Lamellibrachia satsuma)]